MWEYTSVEDSELKKVLEKLNELGKEGWEAFGYTQNLSSFKKNTHLILLKRQK